MVNGGMRRKNKALAAFRRAENLPFFTFPFLALVRCISYYCAANSLSRGTFARAKKQLAQFRGYPQALCTQL
jgi:hypothetical protein